MEVNQPQTIESLLNTKPFIETRALADLADHLFLMLDDEFPNPDNRQKQALFLISEAWQFLYAASINLIPHDSTNLDDAGDSLEDCDD